MQLSDNKNMLKVGKEYIDVLAMILRTVKYGERLNVGHQNFKYIFFMLMFVLLYFFIFNPRKVVPEKSNPGVYLLSILTV